MNFHLKDLEFKTRIGITTQEQSKPQKIIINLTYEQDTKKAEKTDNINDTLDYYEVHQHIKTFLKTNKHNLLETLHKNLLTSIKIKFPTITNPTLKIKKFPFPKGSIEILPLSKEGLTTEIKDQLQATKNALQNNKLELISI